MVFSQSALIGQNDGEALHSSRSVKKGKPSYFFFLLCKFCGPYLYVFIFSPVFYHLQLDNEPRERVNTWKIKCKMSRVDYGSPDSSQTCKVNSLQQDRIKEYRIERKQCEDFITFVPNFCI